MQWLRSDSAYQKIDELKKIEKAKIAVLLCFIFIFLTRMSNEHSRDQTHQQELLASDSFSSSLGKIRWVFKRGMIVFVFEALFDEEVCVSGLIEKTEKFVSFSCSYLVGRSDEGPTPISTHTHTLQLICPNCKMYLSHLENVVITISPMSPPPLPLCVVSLSLYFKGCV